MGLTAKEFCIAFGMKRSTLNSITEKLKEAGFARRHSFGWLYRSEAFPYIVDEGLLPGGGRPKSKHCWIKANHLKKRSELRIYSGRKGTVRTDYSVLYWPNQLNSCVEARKIILKIAQNAGYEHIHYIGEYGIEEKIDIS